MCAPHELGGKMEGPTVSRFNSQLTKKTMIESENIPVSPISTPLSVPGDDSVISPIVQTRDNKQWIDLDVLSPKLVKELRRQYDPSIKYEPSGALEKGAAKVKAFVRQTKLGIDIRLRRKLNAVQDEVTDIHLVPDSALPDQLYQDEKLPLMPELPASLNEINELPDSSIPQELDATQVPTRASTGDSIIEPLPRYEPRAELHTPFLTTDNGHGRTISPERSHATSHRSSASQSSISATPIRGLSLRDPESGNGWSGSPPKEQLESRGGSVGKGSPEETTGQTFVDTERQDFDEPESAVSFQTIIAALQNQTIGLLDQHNRRSDTSKAEDTFKPFKVAGKATYETETDAEPSSPLLRKASRPSRKRSTALPKRRKSNTKAKAIAHDNIGFSLDSDEEGQPKLNGLLRMQTIPKRLPASSGAEALWSSLIRAQSKILGPEHPLVYQAKSDWAHSRSNSHAKGLNSLSSLTKSKTIAIETLGLVHPWVAAFVEDLKALELTMQDDSNGNDTCTSVATGSVLKESISYDTTHPTSVESTEQREEHTGTILEGFLLNPPVQSMEELNITASEPERVQHDKIDISSSLQTTSAGAKFEKPTITTSFYPTEPGASSIESSAVRSVQLDDLWGSRHSPHKVRKSHLALASLAFDGILKGILNALQWLHYSYGPEQPIEPGKVRVRWTCSCGEQLHDDFVERHRGAARKLERYLNRPRVQISGSGGTPTSPASSYSGYSFGHSSLGAPPSSQTSWSSYGSQGRGSVRGGDDAKPPQTSSGLPEQSQYSPFYEPPWLLACANEDRYTPKLAHLDMAPHKITSDRDLAKSLREHYFTVNKKWWRSLRIRGLTTIEFVQFEVHSNRFCDIRKSPDMPETTEDYSFEPCDLLPPVGSQYLLHLFRHPEDYDGELITYLRSPKRHGRLQLGVGWGINLVEGFLADRVWILVSGFFALGSIIFIIAWEMKKHDIQGASGIAAWILSFSILVVGWLQAYLG